MPEQTTHTPGPWTALPVPYMDGMFGYRDWVSVADANLGAVAYVPGTTYPKVRANLALLLASPLLLEACKALVEPFTDIPDLSGFIPEVRNAVSAGRAAIAKAEGQATHAQH